MLYRLSANISLVRDVGIESSDLLKIKELRGSSQSCFPSKVAVRRFYCPLIAHGLGTHDLGVMSRQHFR